jgi:hypothetical protein
MRTAIALLLVIITAQPLFIRAQDKDSAGVGEVLDQWHRAAAEANFDTYFSLMAPESVFLGTDASEYWDYESFKSFSKPYFERGRAWEFTPVDRHIYFGTDPETSWFDELLETQMGICRGSGVLRKGPDGWKIYQYVLSIAVPNEQVDSLVQMKEEHDRDFIRIIRSGRQE